jgi:hypothetical protein
MEPRIGVVSGTKSYVVDEFPKAVKLIEQDGYSVTDIQTHTDFYAAEEMVVVTIVIFAQGTTPNGSESEPEDTKRSPVDWIVNPQTVQCPRCGKYQDDDDTYCVPCPECGWTPPTCSKEFKIPKKGDTDG